VPYIALMAARLVAGGRPRPSCVVYPAGCRMPEEVRTPVNPTANALSIDPGLLSRLAEIVGAQHVLTGPSALTVYEFDAYTLERQLPAAVVLPGSGEEVARVVRVLHDAGVPFVPRGAGTSLSGTTVPAPGSVVISLARMRRILEVDLRNRRAVVEPGVVNAWITRAVASGGYLFAPDPSSQGACTIGGNVGTNAGGPHTLKYGVTVNHILGLELVLPDGQVVELGGAVEDLPGYDLVGLVTGHEGTLGIVTKVIVRLVREPESCRTLLAVFDSVDAATRTVSQIIERGIIPAALEMMDNLVIRAVEDAFRFGFPTDAAAVLIIEVDGVNAGLGQQAEAAAAICRANGAREIRAAKSENERLRLWAARKKAFAALGRITSSYVTQDGVVPRTRLPEILAFVAQVGRKYGLRIANVFHAGDGNIHPILLYDERNPDEVRRVVQASDEILNACIDMGGSVTGEHGVGVEKVKHLSRMFSPADLEAMLDVRAVFNPRGLCNPGKIFPSPGGCAELQRPRRAAPA
ncbi:MAG TPA: FAD-linked oxidase C-terminal domain-containing protein, partial [Limnochordales bacterium]